VKNDLSIYEKHANEWWSGKTRWLRTLHKMAPARLRMIDPIVGDWINKDVLDLGCGGGFLAEEMARRGARVVGVDPSRGAIGAAVDHARRSGLRIDYMVGVGENIPLADGSFDVVACVDVLEHVADLSLVLAQVRRVLRPGGLFVFDTINRNWLAKLVIVTLGEQVVRLLPEGTHDPNLFIKPSELSEALTLAGFELGPMKGFGPRGIDRNLDFRFGPHPLTSIMYLGHARVRP
jgi:2-polyprenyl-6-hydroxyphenyl methylase / 3-demethylubiquinone-9 3-methyltransferase